MKLNKDVLEKSLVLFALVSLAFALLLILVILPTICLIGYIN